MSNTTNTNKIKGIYCSLSLDELLYVRNQVNIKKWKAYKLFKKQEFLL